MISFLNSQVVTAVSLVLLYAIVLLSLWLRRDSLIDKLVLTPADDVTPSSPKQATISANERAEFISAYLDEPVWRRALEIPPGFDIGKADELSEAEAVSQQLRFQCYRSSAPLLLMDRAVDLLEVFSRVGFLPRWPIFSVHLEYDRQRRSEERLSRWRIVIGYPDRDRLRALLQPFNDWLGLRIAIRAPHSIKLQGQCREPGGGPGQCGGRMRTAGDASEYLVTCEHVLAPGCQSTISPRIPPGATSPPDIAVIRPNACFQTDRQSSPVLPASSEDLLQASARRESVAFASRASIRRGLLRSPAPGYATKDGRFWRVPCVRIEAPGIRWPLKRLLGIGQRFSRAGDSGSWIVLVGRDESIWAGMVVGADDIARESYAIEPDFVARYCRVWIERQTSWSGTMPACEAFV